MSVHCPNLAILIYINSDVCIHILISEKPVSLPPPLFTLHLITATQSTSVFLSFKPSPHIKNFLLLILLSKPPNAVMSYLFLVLSTGSKLLNELITSYLVLRWRLSRSLNSPICITYNSSLYQLLLCCHACLPSGRLFWKSQIAHSDMHHLIFATHCLFHSASLIDLLLFHLLCRQQSHHP